MFVTSITAVLLALSPASSFDDWVEPPMLEIGGPPPCDDDTDCRVYPDRPFCDDTSECVECLTDEHCDEGWGCHPSGTCRDACATDEDCEGVGDYFTCDPESGFCVGCLSAEQCTEEEYCQQQTCLPDHCTPGEQLCFGGSVVLCEEDGGTTVTVERCPGPCEELEGGAQCQQPVDTTGGNPGGDSGSGGGETAGSGGPTSATGGADTSAGGTGGDTTPQEETPIRDGCSCRSDATPTWSWAGLLLLGAGLRRRRSA